MDKYLANLIAQNADPRLIAKLGGTADGQQPEPTPTPAPVAPTAKKAAKATKARKR